MTDLSVWADEDRPVRRRRRKKKRDRKGGLAVVIALLVTGPVAFVLPLATAGPGVTNCVTAIANAQLERAPVLLIAAERDDLGTVQTQQELAALMPDSTLVVLPEVGHLVHYEAPDAAAGHIADFVESRTR